MNALLVLALLACGGSDPSHKPLPPDKAPFKPRTRARTKVAKAPAAPPGELQPVRTRADGSKPPNVLVVVWDTVRADRTSIYGYDKPTTPRIKAWAEKNALVYERGVSPGVWTLPSHASLFTALPVRAHGVTAETKFLEDRFVTVAEALSEVGYETWSFCSNPYMSEESNLLQGFRRVEHPWDKDWEPKVLAHMNTKLYPQDASTPVSPAWDEKGRGGAGGNKYLYKESGPVAAEAFTRFLDGAEEGRPWFGFINYMEAHLPRIPTMDARKTVMTDAQIERGWTVLQTTTHFHEWMVGVRPYDPLDLEAISGIYDASLIDLDLATEQLLDVLEAKGLRDDTIVIITSDHGESLGEHDLLLHKYAVYNSLSRVPLMISWPGHVEPGRESKPKSVSDILADAVKLGEIPVTKPVARGLASRPTVGLDGAVTEFNAVATGSLDRMGKLHRKVELGPFRRTFQAIEVGPWKYQVASDGGEELYKVVDDPAELTNLATSAVDDRVRSAAALKAWKEGVSEYKVGAGVVPRAELDDDRKAALEALGYVE